MRVALQLFGIWTSRLAAVFAQYIAVRESELGEVPGISASPHVSIVYGAVVPLITTSGPRSRAVRSRFRPKASDHRGDFLKAISPMQSRRRSNNREPI